MQRVMPFLLVLLTCSLLSCETNKRPKIIGAEKTSICGELPAGVTIDKREFRLAIAKLGEFSLGDTGIKSTPEFTQILSEASQNKVVQSVLTCNAIELAGVAHDAEMVAYFLHLQDFLSTNPSLDDRIKWTQAFPFPTTRKPAETSQKKAALFVSINCTPETLPMAGKHREQFYVIYLHPKSGGKLVTVMFGTGETQSYFPDSKTSGSAYRCEILNSSQDHISSLSVPIAVDFRGKGYSQFSWKMQVPIPAQLAPNGHFVMHIHDDTGWLPEVELPKVVSGRILGEKTEREIAVEYATLSGDPPVIRFPAQRTPSTTFPLVPPS